MKATSNKDLNKILNQAVDNGATIDRRAGRHLKLRFPNGQIVVVGTTISDWRGIRNIQGEIRRALK